LVLIEGRIAPRRYSPKPFGHTAIYIHCQQAGLFGHLPQLGGEKPIPLKQIAWGPFRVTGLRGDAPQSGPTFKRGEPELRSRDEPYSLARTVERQLRELGEQQRLMAIIPMTALALHD
jgi:hypothetical protein